MTDERDLGFLRHACTNEHLPFHRLSKREEKYVLPPRTQGRMQSGRAFSLNFLGVLHSKIGQILVFKPAGQLTGLQCIADSLEVIVEVIRPTRLFCQFSLFKTVGGVHRFMKCNRYCVRARPLPVPFVINTLTTGLRRPWVRDLRSVTFAAASAAVQSTLH